MWHRLRVQSRTNAWTCLEQILRSTGVCTIALGYKDWLEVCFYRDRS